MNTSRDTTTGSALVALSDLTPMMVFGNPAQADAIIEKIKDEVTRIDADISTAQGRAEIRATAYKIARSKTVLDEMGKDLVRDLKARSGVVDAERRRIWDALETLQVEFRKPLTDFEEAEKARVAAHEAALAAIEHTMNLIPGVQLSALELAGRAKHAAELLAARDWQEFAKRAAGVAGNAIATLEIWLRAAEQREANEAEAEQRRQEDIARQQRERDERLAAEAADRARKEAEAKAAEKARRAAEKVTAERRRIEEEKAAAEARARKAEADRLAAEAAGKAAAEAAVAEQHRIEAERKAALAKATQAEATRLAIEAKAKADAEAVQRRVEADRKAAAEQANRDRLAAVEAERQRVATEQAREIAEARRREADRSHRTRINREARDALVNAGLSAHAATSAVTAIAKGDVPHVKINY